MEKIISELIDFFRTKISKDCVIIHSETDPQIRIESQGEKIERSNLVVWAKEFFEKEGYRTEESVFGLTLDQFFVTINVFNPSFVCWIGFAEKNRLIKEREVTH
jgi:hypothetical protein